MSAKSKSGLIRSEIKGQREIKVYGRKPRDLIGVATHKTTDQKLSISFFVPPLSCARKFSFVKLTKEQSFSKVKK